MNSIKQLASQTAIYGLSNVLGRMLNYLLTPLYLRIFLPESYGQISLLYAYATFLMVVLSYGMETAFFRFAKEKEAKAAFSSAGISLIISSVIFGIGIHFAGDSIASWFSMEGEPHLVQWLGWIIAIDTFNNLAFAYLRQQNKAWHYAIIRLINIGTYLFLNLFWLVWAPQMGIDFSKWPIFAHIKSDLGISSVFLANFCASLLTTFLLVPFIPRLIYGSMALFKEMLKYGYPLIGVGLAGMVNETLDRIMLEHLLPLPAKEARAEVGVYAAAYKVAMLMSIFTQTFRMAAEPFFFSKANLPDAKQLYATVMNYFVITASLILWVVLVFDDPIKAIFFGNGDSAYIQGLAVVPILLLANLFLGIYYNLSIWYKLADQTKKGAIISLIGALITIAGLWVSIPIIGYWGAAITTLICYLSMVIIAYLWGNKVLPIPYQVLPLLMIISYTLINYIIQKQILLQLIVTDVTWKYGVKAFFTSFWFIGVYFVQKRWKML